MEEKSVSSDSLDQHLIGVINQRVWSELDYFAADWRNLIANAVIAPSG